ncbi:hypothetical protein L211DRAFT_880629 [Terfezia boudieri ATCC MYA-4762]|uniref:Uncharacterized protein n=1 Tax=Terfezia boudieri ATCC MYA-4762 TaxID=1051890 RepID=A0A3N4LM82_9PEZI|nr:hypothetical protein L211DRAFT_880629 [Terfezia boudieri ATCC MYA-4762]
MPLTIRDVLVLGQAVDLLKEKFNAILDELKQSKDDYYDLLRSYRRDHLKPELVDTVDDPQEKGKGPEETPEQRLERVERLYHKALSKIKLLTETHIPIPFEDEEFLRRVNIIIKAIHKFSWKFTKSDDLKSPLPVISNPEHLKFLNPAFGPLTEQGVKILAERLRPQDFRCHIVNIIMLRGLFQRYFVILPMGIPLHSAEDIAIKILLDIFHGSGMFKLLSSILPLPITNFDRANFQTDKEIHQWKAQTVHLLSKRGEFHHLPKDGLVPCTEFKKCLDSEIKAELELIWSELGPYANPPKETIPALRTELENIIRLIAELGILFSRVTEWKLQPMAPYSVKVGEKFDENYMVLMNKASEEIYKTNPEAPVTCVLNAPWRKATFTLVGETTVDEGIDAFIKAQVSLVNYGLSLDLDDGDVLPFPANDGLDAWGSIAKPVRQLESALQPARVPSAQPPQSPHLDSSVTEVPHFLPQGTGPAAPNS